MSAINLCLWIAGMALQLVLAALLFVRGVARRFPVFTVLIGFYILRSLLLMTVFGYLARDTYRQIFEIFSWIDLLLEILLAAELGAAILRQAGGSNRISPRRAAIGTALVLVACALAAVAAALLPTPGRVPVDRGGAFSAVLMLVLLAWAVLARVQGAPRHIVEGFAIYGAAGVAIGLERSYAALHRNGAAFAAGSYAQAGIYMAIVVYWLFTLRMTATSTAPSQSSPLRPAAH
jgi:hypothetical protein